MCALCGVASHIPETPLAANAPDRARFAALRNPDCRNYIVGASLSMMGDSIEHVITYWVLYQQFHSPALAGFAVISHWVPLAVLGLLRRLGRPLRLPQDHPGAQMLYMSVSAVWGVLFLTNSLQMWHAMVLLVDARPGWRHLGARRAAHAARHRRPRERCPARYGSTRPAAAWASWPGRRSGSVLLLGLGPALGIFANVLMYLPMTIWLLRMPYTGHLRDGGLARRPRVSPLEAVRVLREVAGQPVLISMVRWAA